MYLSYVHPFSFFLSLPQDTFSLFLGEKEGGERERERHRLIAVQYVPQPGGMNVQPRPVPGLGTEPSTFQFTGQRSSQLSPTSQGHAFLIHATLYRIGIQVLN